jgi:Suppressor of fused protein (SUFU)
MLDGLLEHLEAHLGEIAGEWETDPDGNELPFQIVHYGAGKAPPGTEIFSTLGLSDYELGEHGARIELLMIAPVGLTSGTIPPILHHAGLMPIDADDVPELGDTYTAVEELGEVSPMDALYVGRPLYQPTGFNPFDGPGGRVAFWWLIPIYDVEAEYIENEGWEAFEQLMWDLDVDPTDFTRNPWLDD